MNLGGSCSLRKSGLAVIVGDLFRYNDNEKCLKVTYLINAKMGFTAIVQGFVLIFKSLKKGSTNKIEKKGLIIF